MKLILSLIALSLPAAAYAYPITGSISIDGTDSYTATAVSFQGAGNVGAGTSTGSFASGFGAGCNGCVTLARFSFVGLGAPVKVYDAIIGAVETTFTITSISSEAIVGPFLNVAATGYATLTGFSQTPGVFEFSSQGGGGKTTFSATTIASAVPEPASFALLGIGLMAVGAIRRWV